MSRQTLGAKVQSREGKSPDHMLRSQNIYWVGKDDNDIRLNATSIDNQEVGLEAAILSRKRKSSLVELTITENVSGLKYITEAVGIKKNLILYSVAERSVIEEGILSEILERSEVRMLTWVTKIMWKSWSPNSEGFLQKFIDVELIGP